MRQYQFYIYIVTNPQRTVLYTGITNNLAQRLIEHYSNRGQPQTFAGKFYCYNLIYYETFPYADNAIGREKEIKGWSRKKKMDLIKTMNPDWIFMNPSVCEGWPPKEITKRI